MKRITVITAVALISLLFTMCGDSKTPKSGADGKTAPQEAVAEKEVVLTDARDSQTYRTVKIGGMTWMAQNLNFKTDNSFCYDNDDANCAKYGRLYTRDAARNACPAEWRMPSDADWNALAAFAGWASVAGTKLSSRTGWNTDSSHIPGTDDFGFSAMPGGLRSPDGNFLEAGSRGYWWTSTETEDGSNISHIRHIYYNISELYSGMGQENRSFSLRCLQGASDGSDYRGNTLTGKRDRADIQRIITMNMAGITRMHINYRLENPNLQQGKVTVRFTIDASGKATSAEVAESTVNDSKFEQTVVNRVRSWSFGALDESDDVTEVVYPFIFSPERALVR